MTAARFGQVLAWQLILLQPTVTAGYLWGWVTGLFVYFFLIALCMIAADARDAIVRAIRMGPLA